MEQYIRNGVFFPDVKTSALEKRLFDDMESRLIEADFKYLSVPSLVTRETYERQGVVPWSVVFKVDANYALAGSAEQGILEMFTNKEVGQELFYAKNQCFRAESEFEGMKRLREFNKLEQFAFCYPGYVEYYFEKMLDLATGFLKDHGIEYRVVDATERDPGYHRRKFDIEVLTHTYGWLETHSCSYFGTEQVRRFGIQGNIETLSNTGIASPRILVPFLER